MKLKRVDNGVIVKYDKYEYGDNEMPVEQVYEIQYHPPAPPVRLVELLYDIVESVYGNDGHNEFNLRIKIEHGRKWECKDKNCKICKGEEL